MLVSASALVSCSDQNDGQNTQNPYYLEFVNPTDAQQVYTPDFNGKYEVGLNTNVPKSKLRLSDDGVQTWCAADLNEEGDAILITPGLAVSSDLTASFTLEGVGVDVAPLVFEVKRLYQEVEHDIKVFMAGEELTGEYPMHEVSGSQNSVSVEVRTNASRWMMSYDSYSDDDQWFAADKSSGANGETCTFTFDKNTSGLTRSQTFVFKPGFTGTDKMVSLTFVQKAWSAIESVVVKKFDNTTMTVGQEIADGTEFTLPSGNTAKSPFCFAVEVVGEGGVEVKFAEPGSNVFHYTAPGEWIFGGLDMATGEYFKITTTENNGAERSMDAVLVDASGVELFRFRFTQQA